MNFILLNNLLLSGQGNAKLEAQYEKQIKKCR